MKIISGGQTGVDRAGLDAAMELGLQVGGWCPKGRLAEDGRVPDKYPLKEHADASYVSRTAQNILDSDATLLIFRGKLSGGSLMTFRTCYGHRKPCLLINLSQKVIEPDVTRVIDWLKDHKPKVLNIAGPRESKRPGIYDTARLLVTSILTSTLGL